MKMLAAVKERPESGLHVTEVEVPKIGPNEVLVKIKAASICGTDLHIYMWNNWAQGRVTNIPIIQGHEMCGEIADIGPGVTNVKVGDFVSAESHIVCNQCDLCKSNKKHICRNTKIIGVEVDGCFAEYIALPAENARKNQEKMPVDTAVLMENFGNAVHVASTPEVKDKTIMLSGCGPVGVMTIAVCKALGAKKVIAVNPSPYRLELAKKMGADETVSAKDESFKEKILDLTDGKGVDIFMEMSGAPSSIQSGYELLKYGGTAIAFGLPSDPISFDFSNLVVFKGITIYGIIGRKLWETWDLASELIYTKKVDLSPIITHRYNLKEISQGFQTMLSGKSGKVVLYPIDK
ncbi:MAG: L-threonine 3-dehydrogenase [bacterium]